MSGWLPITFSGVASLALGPKWRFRVVRLILAVASSVVVTWYWQAVVARSIRSSVWHLTSQGAIQGGRLEWTGPPTAVLCESPHLSILISLNGGEEAGQVTDFQIELGRTAFRFRSMFGKFALPYRPEWRLDLRRETLEPWWGAWEPALLAGVFCASVLGLHLIWMSLGAFYGLGMWLYVLYLDRAAGWGVCWRASQAALVPGALLIDLAIVGYSVAQIDLLGFLFAAGLHFVVGWIYLILAPWHFPRVKPAPRSRNPFAASS